MKRVVLIAHNLRSTHNVGSLLRTAEGLGVGRVFLTGYTPYPLITSDPRLPHLSAKIDSQVHKTALGAEKLIDLSVISDIEPLLNRLKLEGYTLVALEQAKNSISLADFKSPEMVALVVGREVEGLEPEVLALCDTVVEIPMKGQKESFNVVQAAAMALYVLCYTKD